MASEKKSEFCQQAVTTANLLLEAASLLESSQPGSSVPPRSLSRSYSSPHQSGPSRENNALGPQQRPSVSTELRGLFNWSGRGKRRKKTFSSGPAKKKTKKLQTWTHSWVCLSGTGDDLVPERVSLKMAGLGESRFAVDVSATAQEVCDALEAQFPKLPQGGGFELLRTEEGCPRELAVIPIPDGGYTVDYLKAVVHNAKIYIRPLQTDLSLDPRPADVCVYHFLYIIIMKLTLQDIFPVPEGMCKKCKRLIAVSELKKHIASCWRYIVEDEYNLHAIM